eukprot:gnl/Dysnectes_brevis/5648_a8246_487.p1 GENE.gnl/Dysnectes_brevis/5648_a8246_487~~gnl/Dysnectes_brevis/5648_a8246_487.p1  ORF type:complete len:301 (+),score=84.83 gnl/Dysnectes_brevis/5648_a8246_487:132-1034(+)
MSFPTNTSYDEVIDVDDSSAESIASNPMSRQGAQGRDRGPQFVTRTDIVDRMPGLGGSESDGMGSEHEIPDHTVITEPTRQRASLKGPGTEHSDIREMANEELMHLFQLFTPEDIPLETKLVPYLPDYTPTVGDVDPFVKIPRPDGKPEPLGMLSLDEPGLQQTDPTVLELQLRGACRGHIEAESVAEVRSIPFSKRAVSNWIERIEVLHQKQGPAEVSYSRPPPDTLMDQWPQSVEAVLRRVGLPTADIDLSVEEYARLVCSLLGVPISEESGGSLIESLHMLFTLHHDIMTSIAFQQS